MKANKAAKWIYFMVKAEQRVLFKNKAYNNLFNIRKEENKSL